MTNLIDQSTSSSTPTSAWVKCAHFAFAQMNQPFTSSSLNSHLCALCCVLISHDARLKSVTPESLSELEPITTFARVKKKSISTYQDHQWYAGVLCSTWPQHSQSIHFSSYSLQSALQWLLEQSLHLFWFTFLFIQHFWFSFDLTLHCVGLNARVFGNFEALLSLISTFSPFPLLEVEVIRLIVKVANFWILYCFGAIVPVVGVEPPSDYMAFWNLETLNYKSEHCRELWVMSVEFSCLLFTQLFYALRWRSWKFGYCFWNSGWSLASQLSRSLVLDCSYRQARFLFFFARWSSCPARIEYYLKIGLEL